MFMQRRAGQLWVPKNRFVVLEKAQRIRISYKPYIARSKTILNYKSDMHEALIEEMWNMCVQIIVKSTAVRKGEYLVWLERKFG